MSKPILPALAVTLLLGTGIPATSQEDARFLMLQARAMQRRGGGDNPEGAAALYRRIIALTPNSAQAHLRLSEAILEAGDLAGAVEPALKATQLEPANSEAWAHLGLLYYYQSQSSEAARPHAETALRKAARLLPNDAEVWTRLAETEEGLKHEESALKAWLTVGRLHPSAPFRGRNLGDYGFERSVELAISLKQYEARREAVLALCDERYPDRRHLKLLEDLARDQVEAGFLGHALDSFEQLALHVPQEPAIWENIAVIQLRTNRFEEALGSLAKAEALKPSSRSSFHSGLCLMKLGRFKEAEQRWKALEPALGDTKEDVDLRSAVRVLYATCLLLQGRPGDLLDLSASWDEALNNSELMSLRAQALLQKEDWKVARAVLKDGIARFPDQDLFRRAKELPRKLFNEGLLFKGESRKALAQLNLEAMAGLWAEFQGWQQCLDVVRKARLNAPAGQVELLLLEANALESLDRSDEAMQALRTGQKLNPGHPTLQNNLGFLLLEKGGDLQEATRLIEASLKQDPKNSSTMDSWGWALFKNGRYPESEAVLRKAAALSPFSAEVHRHLGEALVKLDRLQEALEEWDRALAFAFPQRKELEDQARELRTRLAKSRKAESAEDPASSSPGEDPEDEASDEEEEL